jgi:hypothetical protein
LVRILFFNKSYTSIPVDFKEESGAFMSKWIRFLWVSWLFIFAIVACSPKGEQELVSEEIDATETQTSPENEAGTLDDQSSLDNIPEFRGSRNYNELEIVTLLPQDGIPAIDNPEFLSAEEADSEYAPDELVIGVNYEGDARAYSIPFLSGHEIVNDTVGGKKIAVTW